MAEYFRARSTFVCNTGSGLRTVRKDSLVTDDDPAYKNAPHLFQAVADAVEQATAGPGERRGPLQHLHKAAKKAAPAKKTPSGKAGAKAGDDDADGEQNGDGEKTPPADEQADGDGAGEGTGDDKNTAEGAGQ